MRAVIGALLGACLSLTVLLLAGRRRVPRQRPTPYLRRLIASADAQRLTPSGLVAASIALATVVALLLLAITAVPAIAILGLALGGTVPTGLLRRRAARHRAAVQAAWPDAVDILMSAVRAGMSLPEAVVDLSLKGPQPLRPAFAEFADHYRASGSFALALDSLKARLGDPVADRVIASLVIARDVGGTDLGRVLASLSAFLRDDSRTRGEIAARQSWTVNAARLAVAAPWVTVALLCTRGEAVDAYASGAGLVLLLGAGVLSAVAYRVMIAMGRLPSEPRVMQ